MFKINIEGKEVSNKNIYLISAFIDLDGIVDECEDTEPYVKRKLNFYADYSNEEDYKVYFYFYNIFNGKGIENENSLPNTDNEVKAFIDRCRMLKNIFGEVTIEVQSDIRLGKCICDQYFYTIEDFLKNYKITI